MGTALRSIPVRAASRAYEVVIGEGLLAGAAPRIGGVLHGARAVHVFVDEGLPVGVGADLVRRLDASGFRVTSSKVRASEDGKVMQTLYHMVQQLAAHDLERKDGVIALGGGITGDMAGFAAATYRRSIPWINCPTTLLSMVDASVGGKTGVNLRVDSAGERGGSGGFELRKNMVGAFWQPSLVLADVAVLSSLDARDYRAGLAECFKHAMLSADFGDPMLMSWTKEHVGAIMQRDAETLVELIARNVTVKARVVGEDEREEADASAGGRALLNLGHTFGHAIETMAQVSPVADRSHAPLRHGEAVALGLVCAARCAELLKLVGDGVADAVRRTLEHAGLPGVAHHLPPAKDVYEAMRHDKKTSGGRMRLVLPCGEGTCKVVVAPAEGVVLEAIEAIRA